MERDNAKRFARDFARKAWRKAQVAKTGSDPDGEAELQNMLAEQKLLDLTREYDEAQTAARAAEAAAAEAEAQPGGAPQVGAPQAAEAAAAAAPGENPGQA